MILAVITTRDGVPNQLAARRLSIACERVGAQIGVTACPHTVDVSRNQGVVLAKASGASHLFFCDNDTLVEPDALEKLLSLDAPVATGQVPTLLKTDAGFQACITVGWERDERGLVRFCPHWITRTQPVRFTGAACLLIRTDVFDAIPFPWFEHVHSWDGMHYRVNSEDLSFSDKVHEAGLSIMVHADVRCQHDKPIECGSLLPEEVAFYGNHRPVLERLSRLEPRSVVEYGGGNYSTRLFLDKAVFPELENLLTLENDASWLPQIEDTRWMVAPPSDAFYGADLILIDCADDAAYTQRTELLNRYADSDSVVVLHDIENPFLKAAFDAAPYRYKVRYAPAFGPATGIASNRDISQVAA